MTITIDLQPETEARLQEQAAINGENPSDYAAHALERLLSNGSLQDNMGGTTFDSALVRMLTMTAEERAAMHKRTEANIIPGRALPPGKTLEEVLVGKWPGDETDEQIDAALRELS